MTIHEHTQPVGLRKTLYWLLGITSVVLALNPIVNMADKSLKSIIIPARAGDCYNPVNGFVTTSLITNRALNANHGYMKADTYEEWTGQSPIFMPWCPDFN